MTNKIYDLVFKKSPWDDTEPKENIFTKKRKDQFNFNFDNFQFNFNSKSIILAVIGIILLWLANGFYKVEEGEEAAIIRFGKFHRKAMPGLNYKLPAPIENVVIEKVAQSKRIEIGYRSSGKSKTVSGDLNKDRDITAESLMLTGDENIIELNVDVMWHISNLSDYLFNVSEPEETVRSASQSAIREVIGNIPIASVLSNQKQEIADKIERLIRQILEGYKIGVAIEQVKLLKAEPPKEVIQAYRDVQTAKADKEKEINEAQSYRNNILPKARGQAEKVHQESEGYKVEVIAKAEGDASRFNAIYEEYLLNKEITRNRLYLDALKEILYQADKIIMGGDGMLPHMAIKPKA